MTLDAFDVSAWYVRQRKRNTSYDARAGSPNLSVVPSIPLPFSRSKVSELFVTFFGGGACQRHGSLEARHRQTAGTPPASDDRTPDLVCTPKDSAKIVDF